MNDITLLTQSDSRIRQVGPTPIYPHDYESAWRMAIAISKSGLAPRGIQTPEAIFTAMQLGAEVGLSPMSALQNIAVVNGRPTIWGDAQLALVRASSLLEDFEEKFEGKEGTEDFKAICIAKRSGYKTPSTGEFSIGDAKTAGLWGKDGPWKTNPKRMLKMRARAFALRDGFTDILKGIYSTEEMKDVTPTTIDNTMQVSTVDALNDEFITPENLNTSDASVQNVNTKKEEAKAPENPIVNGTGVAVSAAPSQGSSISTTENSVKSIASAGTSEDKTSSRSCEHKWVKTLNPQTNDPVEICSSCGVVNETPAFLRNQK